MPPLILTLSDEELAAIQWSIAKNFNGDKTVTKPDDWFRNRAAGELAAAVQGYRADRASAIVNEITTNSARSASDVVKAAEAKIIQPAPAAVVDVDAVVDKGGSGVGK